MENRIRAIVWSEGGEPEHVYPHGIHGLLVERLSREPDIEPIEAALDEPGMGLSPEALAKADVLVWFGHKRHEVVPDELADRIAAAVRERRLGFLPLHSSHFAKPFLRLLGTSGKWRSYSEDGRPARLRPVGTHPIVSGVEAFELPRTELYAEPFEAPAPEAVVLEGSYHDGRETVRDGMVWTFGKGRVFYFRPGHETYPIFHRPEVQRILVNGIRWLARRA